MTSDSVLLHYYLNTADREFVIFFYTMSGIEAAQLKTFFTFTIFVYHSYMNMMKCDTDITNPLIDNSAQK